MTRDDAGEVTGVGHADRAVRAVPAVRAADAGRRRRSALARAAARAGRGGRRRQRCAARGRGLRRGARPADRAATPAVADAHPAAPSSTTVVPPPAAAGRLRAATAGRGRASRWSGSRRSSATPTSRPAGSRQPMHEMADTEDGMLAPDRRASGSGSGSTTTDAPVHLTGAQPAGLRRRPDRAGLHAARAPRARLRQRAPWRRCRSGSSTTAPGRACSPTRPTRRRTRSTPRSATGRSSTW